MVTGRSPGTGAILFFKGLTSGQPDASPEALISPYLAAFGRASAASTAEATKLVTFTAADA